MSSKPPTEPTAHLPLRTERVFLRFTRAQRWEHLVLLIAFAVLFATGAPQKYRLTEWSQWLLSTPERLYWVRQIHHVAALVLTGEALYHLGHALFLMARRRLPGDMFPTWQDVRQAGQMLAYLLFLRPSPPAFGKYNFEQKITYWFIFFGVAVMVLSGFILWFPEQVTRILPGGVVPAAYLAHSNEAIVAFIFIVVWHFYHVHWQRLNLSIFTGKLSEEEMRTYHAAEYARLVQTPTETIPPTRGEQP